MSNGSVENLHTSQMTDALGQSEAFILFQEQISKVAPIDRPVLILGERGTGKELAASRIHFLSKRWEQPLVTLNCAALAPTLIESELFGYEKGAFSGAVSRKIGRFETASNGTLFLDEVGSIPLQAQEKILRVVEYTRFERVGASVPIQVDVRIVAATNVDLAYMASAGNFKQDLLDRLSFEVIYVPPLRERKEDILLLANHFAARMAFELGRDEIPTLSQSAIKALEQYPWPGNIRELKNVVERAVYKSESDDISHIVFDPFQHPFGQNLEKPGRLERSGKLERSVDMEKNGKTDSSGIIDIQNRSDRQLEFLDNGGIENHPHSFKGLPLKQAVKQLEIQMIEQALSDCKFNQKKAAGKLGLTYDQFRGVKRKHGIK